MATSEQVLQEITKLKLNEIADLRTTNVRIMAVQDANAVKLDELARIIKGNGKPGLVDRVGFLENTVNMHLKDYEREVKEEEKKEVKEEKQEEKKSDRKFDIGWKVILLFIGAMISGVLGNVISGLFK